MRSQGGLPHFFFEERLLSGAWVNAEPATDLAAFDDVEERSIRLALEATLLDVLSFLAMGHLLTANHLFCVVVLAASSVEELSFSPRKKRLIPCSSFSAASPFSLKKTLAFSRPCATRCPS